MQHSFFSQEDPASLDLMLDIFGPKEGFVWFVESSHSNKWITIYDNCSDEECLTNNPDEARRFKSKMEALSYMINNNLPHKFIATEHEFVDNQTT